jgi:uncharacterized membrane protein (DUF485 family)
MASPERDILDSTDFRVLVRRRWRVSLLLSAGLFLLYYGFIVLVATSKALLATRIGQTTTLGIPLGAGVIVGAWVLTAAYVIWANRRYDADVDRLRDRLRR